ncbi:MAG: chemotaxis protein CheC [Candidatus Hodarchaeales archaeon]
MPETKYDELSEFHLDGLQEVGNIGAGHAAIALTQFLNRSTYMSIPRVALDKIQNVNTFVKMPFDQELAIVSVTTVSDLIYTLLVFIDKDSVKQIIDLMAKKPDSDEEIDTIKLSPLYLSLIKETGSILLLKYVEALNYFLKVNSFPSPPKIRIGTLGSIAEFELSDISQELSKILFIECDIFTSERSISVDLAIVPHHGTFDKFMDKLFSDES